MTSQQSFRETIQVHWVITNSTVNQFNILIYLQIHMSNVFGPEMGGVRKIDYDRIRLRRLRLRIWLCALLCLLLHTSIYTIPFTPNPALFKKFKSGSASEKCSRSGSVPISAVQNSANKLLSGHFKIQILIIYKKYMDTCKFEVLHLYF